MSNNQIYLNSSEHLFNLSFSETLMLRNFAKSNGLNFSSMIGGPESIRDIQEARNLFANALEFDSVESPFAISKICSAVKKTFKNEAEIEKIKIIINISTPDGINLVENINALEIPKFLKKSNFIFNFDRRKITKNLMNIVNDDFEYSEYENQLNPMIFRNINNLMEKKFLTSVSGGITKNSLLNIYKQKVPNYIKTGLFTILSQTKSLKELQNCIIQYQRLEERLLNLMGESIYYRHIYLNRRQVHLKGYLEEEG